MTVRYVSYDYRKGTDYGDLQAFIRKYRGKAISQTLVRFETDSDLATFRDELHEAVEDDSSVYILIRTKDGITHGKPAKGASPWSPSGELDSRRARPAAHGR